MTTRSGCRLLLSHSTLTLQSGRVARPRRGQGRVAHAVVVRQRLAEAGVAVRIVCSTTQ